MLNCIQSEKCILFRMVALKVSILILELEPFLTTSLHSVFEVLVRGSPLFPCPHGYKS